MSVPGRQSFVRIAMLTARRACAYCKLSENKQSQSCVSSWFAVMRTSSLATSLSLPSFDFHASLSKIVCQSRFRR